MILELKISNLVLIENIHLDLDKGFVVFTGETGAGKSLLIKAVKLLLGEKGGANYIRPGAKEGEIEAIIWGGEKLSQKLQEAGYTPQEEIHVRRIFSPNRQKIYINGSPVTLTELSKLTKDLILLTSQHEFYTLLSSEKQLEFLDHFLELIPYLKEYQELYYKYKSLVSQIKEIEEKIASSQLRKDFLLFQIREIEELKPNPEEEENLQKEREKLKNLSLLKEKTQFLLSNLEEIEKNFYQIVSSFESLSKIEHKFKDHYSKVFSMYYELKEIARDLIDYSSHLPEDDTALNEIEERLSKYEKLKRKYKRDTQGLIKLLEELKEEISLLEVGEENYENLLKEEETLKKKLIESALKLSEERLKGIPKLQSLLKKELKDLGMEKADFKIELILREPKIENLGPLGLDEVKFLFSSNPGVPLKPLEKVASGGELSRIFLACKSILKEKTEAGSLIFDEVDVGIGGTTAKKIAQKLKDLSQNYQVLCVTHLPQIAVLADIHYVVEKEIKEKETKTKIKKVEGEERLKEIARMLGDPQNLELAKSFLEAQV
ncbi:Sigma 54 interacting domain protein [Thermodesulfobacterium geofontis OPF15]|uniref:DNA repair protein RecN n=1 Tax=Thermodesulfobacterium geofontis (strain OPF15) TaxID=795359 RepID=F8C5P1_THEGP|nr:DNA repair protein RecN [Thermodesulfobacterium geofontis]AEH23027.1 Sigma 54 interacting domain protein [Thermodesulfobacterium geofontis OPF15]